MNDIDKDKIIELSNNDYISTSEDNAISTKNINLGSLWIFAIPIVFSLFSGKEKKDYKHEANAHNLPVKSITPPTEKNYNQQNNLKSTDQMIDKLSGALGVMKKVNQLSEIKKVTSSKQNNLDNVQEAFSIFKNVFSDTSNSEKIDTLENTISTIKKFSEVKKVLDLQKTFTSNKDNNPSLDNMVDAISPLLSDNNNDNVKNLQKVVKMANLISALNSNNHSDEENT